MTPTSGIKRWSRLLIAASLFIAGFASLWAERLPNNVTVLTRDDFKGRHFYSVGDALEGVLSLDLQKNGYRGTQTVAKFRGGSSANQVAVFLDGRPLSHEFNSIVDLSQIPLAIVERIEITRGASSFSYGAQAISGSINIVTSRPHRPGLLAQARTLVGRDGVRSSQGRLLGRANFWGNAAYMGSKELSGGYMFNEESESVAHYGNISRSFHGKGYWGVEYYYQESQVGLTHGTTIPFNDWNARLERAPVSPTHQKREESQFVRLNVGSPLILGGTIYADITQSRRFFSERPDPKDAAILDQESRASTIRVRWKCNNFEWGGQNRVLKRKIFPEIEEKTFINGFYALHKFSTKKFTLSSSIRHDRHRDLQSVTSYKLTTVYAPLEKWQISGNWGTGVRFPTFDELFPSTPAVLNTRLKPERSTSFDVGFSYNPTKNIRLQFTAYRTLVDRLIVRRTPPQSTFNQGRELNKGVESELNARLGQTTRFLNVEFKGQWSYHNSQRNLRDGKNYQTSAMTPRHLINLSLTQYLPHNFSLTHQWRYQSDQYELANREGLRLNSYYVYNVILRVKILKSYSFFEVDNLTRRRYADNLSPFTFADGSAIVSRLPQPERTFWAGIQVEFAD